MCAYLHICHYQRLQVGSTRMLILLVTATAQGTLSRKHVRPPLSLGGLEIIISPLLWQLSALDRRDGVQLFAILHLETSYTEKLAKYALAI